MKYRTKYQREKCAGRATPSFCFSWRDIPPLLSPQASLALCLALCTAQALPAQRLGPAFHRAPKPVTFVTPKPAQVFATPAVPVKIHIADDMNPATLKITFNGKNVTDRFTVSSACSPESCDESASLILADGIKSGWNHLWASASSDRGAVESERLRFFYKDGLLEDSTDASEAPFDVDIAVQSNGDVQLNYNPA